LPLKLIASTQCPNGMAKRRYIWWGYAVELLAAGFVLLALCLWFDLTAVASFVRDVAIDLATLFGAVVLTASLGFLWTFYSKADTDFYRWLDARGAFRVYLVATAYSVVVGLLSTMILVAMKKVANEVFSVAGAYFLILAIINLITLVRNVIDLMLLNAKFNHVRAGK
jgi:hypothetical protein